MPLRKVGPPHSATDVETVVSTIHSVGSHLQLHPGLRNPNVPYACRESRQGSQTRSVILHEKGTDAIALTNPTCGVFTRALVHVQTVLLSYSPLERYTSVPPIRTFVQDVTARCKLARCGAQSKVPLSQVRMA